MRGPSPPARRTSSCVSSRSRSSGSTTARPRPWSASCAPRCPARRRSCWTAPSCLRRRGKPAEAATALEEARATSPDSPWAYERLAQLAHEGRRRADAERWWRLALERDPENAGLAQRLAALAPDALPLGDRLAPTAEDIERAIRSADKVKVHPGSHEIVLLDDEVTTVNPDGSSKRIITMVAKAVTTEGRDALIQASIPSRRVTSLEAYSVKKNGERQEASSIQGGTVRFRGLEVGSIAVLKYAYYAPPPGFLPNEYVGKWLFQAPNAQVEQLAVAPRAAEGQGPQRGDARPDRAPRGGRRRAEGVDVLREGRAAALAGAEHDARRRRAWTAAVSTLSSWDAYARWEAALLSEAFTSSPELDALAKKLTAGARTPREKLDRLTAHVAQEIRYQQEYEDTIAGVKPHSAGVVLERGYGDCKDKAVLMIRLAKAIGIDLRFAVLRTTPFGKVWKQIPNQQFNHAIVYAPKQPGIDEGFFIDTTTNGLDIGNIRTDDEGALSLVIDPESGRWEFVPIPYQSADLEYFKHQMTVDLTDPEKAVGHDRLEARGGAAAGVRVALRSGEGAKKYYQSLSDQLFSGTTLIAGKADHDQDLTRPLGIDLDIDLRNAVKPEDEHRRLDVPLFFPPARAAALSTRQHPLRLWRGAEELAIDVDLGPGAAGRPPAVGLQRRAPLLHRVAQGRDEGVARGRADTLPEHVPRGRPGGLSSLPRGGAAGGRPPARRDRLRPEEGGPRPRGEGAADRHGSAAGEKVSPEMPPGRARPPSWQRPLDVCCPGIWGR